MSKSKLFRQIDELEKLMDDEPVDVATLQGFRELANLTPDQIATPEQRLAAQEKQLAVLDGMLTALIRARRH